MPVIPAELDRPSTPRTASSPCRTSPRRPSPGWSRRSGRSSAGAFRAFAPDGHTDLVQSIAEVVPPLVIGAAMGLDPADCREIRELAGNFLSSAKVGIEAKIRAAKELEAWLEQRITERRERPTGDTLSALVNARIDGEPIPPMIALGMVQLMVVAATRPPCTASAACCFRVAASRTAGTPVGRPQLLRATVHESLRIDPPIMHMARTAVDDHPRAGAELRAGDKVMLNYGAANGTGEVRPPRGVDIDRPANQHLSFGTADTGASASTWT